MSVQIFLEIHPKVVEIYQTKVQILQVSPCGTIIIQALIPAKSVFLHSDAGNIATGLCNISDTECPLPNRLEQTYCRDTEK